MIVPDVENADMSRTGGKMICVVFLTSWPYGVKPERLRWNVKMCDGYEERGGKVRVDIGLVGYLPDDLLSRSCSYVSSGLDP